MMVDVMRAFLLHYLQTTTTEVVEVDIYPTNNTNNIDVVLKHCCSINLHAHHIRA